MIEVVTVDAAADADALAGTDLETIPSAGLLLIFVASTVNTATITMTTPGRQTARTIAIKLRANGVPNVDQDSPVFSLPVQAGTRPVVNLGGTTGTIFTVARFFDVQEIEAGLVS